MTWYTLAAVGVVKEVAGRAGVPGAQRAAANKETNSIITKLKPKVLKN